MVLIRLKIALEIFLKKVVDNLMNNIVKFLESVLCRHALFKSCLAFSNFRNNSVGGANKVGNLSSVDY